MTFLSVLVLECTGTVLGNIGLHIPYYRRIYRGKGLDDRGANHQGGWSVGSRPPTTMEGVRKMLHRHLFVRTNQHQPEVMAAKL